MPPDNPRAEVPHSAMQTLSDNLAAVIGQQPGSIASAEGTSILQMFVGDGISNRGIRCTRIKKRLMKRVGYGSIGTEEHLPVLKMERYFSANGN